MWLSGRTVGLVVQKVLGSNPSLDLFFISLSLSWKNSLTGQIPIRLLRCILSSSMVPNEVGVNIIRTCSEIHAGLPLRRCAL